MMSYVIHGYAAERAIRALVSQGKSVDLGLEIFARLDMEAHVTPALSVPVYFQ